MCGETIRGQPKIVRVEGAELQVCAKCGKFGTEVQQMRRTDIVRPAGTKPAGNVKSPAVTPSAYRKRDMFDFIEGEIVDDYNVKIRNARMEMGLSQKDLALQMKEKEHLIQKIENHDLIPEEHVRKKLEKVLGIRLIDAPETDVEKKVPGSMAPTLGDLTIIRKAKK
jgi:putative transcription factor